METIQISSKEFNLLDLPIELILAVLHFLDPKSLCYCAIVCRQIQDLSQDEVLWKKFLFRWNLACVAREVPTVKSLKLNKEIYLQLSAFSNPYRIITLETAANFLYSATDETKWRLCTPEQSKRKIWASYQPDQQATSFGIRSSMQLDATLEEVTAAILDIDNYQSWDPAVSHCCQMKYVEQGTDLLRINYPPGPYTLLRHYFSTKDTFVHFWISQPESIKPPKLEINDLDEEPPWKILPTGWFITETNNKKNCIATHILEIDTCNEISFNLVWAFCRIRGRVLKNFKNFIRKIKASRK